MYCQNCWNEVKEEANFGDKCGYSFKFLTSNFAPKEKVATPSNNKFIASLLFFILGVVGVIYASATISDNKDNFFSGYNFSPPLSDYEQLIIWVLLISVACIIRGLIGLVSSMSK